MNRSFRSLIESRSSFAQAIVTGVTIVLFLTQLSSAQFELVLIDGESSTAEKVSITNGNVTAKERTYDINEFRLIDFQKEIRNEQSSAHIELSGTGSIGVKSFSLANETFTLQNIAGEIRLGVEAVSEFRFKAEALPLFDKTNAKEESDQLFVKIKGNYQIVPGFIESITEDEVKMSYDGDDLQFKVADVYGAKLASGFADPDNVNCVVFLTEGSQIGCKLKSLDSEKLVAEVAGVAEVQIPADVISKLEIRSNRLRYLSELTPLKADYSEAMVLSRKLNNDFNIAGGPLQLRYSDARQVKTYSKGLGTKSGMTLVYENSGFEKFVTTVGIDAETKGNGLCSVKVYADDTVVFESELEGSDDPQEIDVEIADAKELKLEIDFGRDFLDLSDHVNWCDARFVKGSN